MTAHDYDVLIIGGGVTGLACAGLLRNFLRPRREPLRIGVLEARAPRRPAADAGPGLRVFAIAPAGRAILEACGAWDTLPPGMAAPYERMRVWQADSTPFGPGSIGFDAADSGAPGLGHIVDHDWLRLGLWNALADQGGGPVDLLTGASPAGLDAGPEAMTVRLPDGTSVRARLLVGADGADSWVRSQLQLPTTARDYGQLAVVGHVGSERPHQRTAWQRFTPGGPVALLPLADGRSSIVWSCFEPEAREISALADDEFGARLTAATGSVLGDLRVTTPRLAVPLAARHTHRYTGARFALVGDAAHQIHPLAGQGINLGLLDAAALAETLAAHLLGARLADPGDALVLRRYERWRKGANLLTMAAMEGLHRVFTSDSTTLTRLAAAGLGAVDRLPVVKRLLMAQAAGPADVARGRHAGL
ncbi:MAG: FAD-dependent monooxygenase [Chromatiales bacterium]|nr:FAD-dependent monooxygenase [Chromatiales bacterium]